MLKLNKRTQTKLFSLIVSLIFTILFAVAAQFDSTNVPTNTGATSILSSNEYLVSKVVDGDTIKVKDSDNNEVTVRLIGVNTPETVDPRREVECFGKNASQYVSTLLSNQVVTLQFDSTQDQTDKYGRLLAYVYLNNALVNQLIIQNGYGYEYTYQVPYIYQTEFKLAQQQAQQQNLGLWGECGDIVV